MNIDELIMQYRDKFGENFPIFSMASASDKEIKEAIEMAIKSGESFTPEEPGEDIMY